MNEISAIIHMSLDTIYKVIEDYQNMDMPPEDCYAPTRMNRDGLIMPRAITTEVSSTHERRARAHEWQALDNASVDSEKKR